MKTVATNTACLVVAGDREAANRRGEGSVKGRIEDPISHQFWT